MADLLDGRYPPGTSATFDLVKKALDDLKTAVRDIGCRVELAAAGQSIPNNTNTTVTWATAIYDTDSLFSLATPTVLTINTKGKYLCITGIEWATSGVGERTVRIRRIRADTSIVLGQVSDIQHAAGGIRIQIVSTIYQFNVGDTVYTRVAQQSGGALLIGGGGYTSWLAVQRIG